MCNLSNLAAPYHEQHSFTTLLGYQHHKVQTLVHPGEPLAAKEALANGIKETSGRGLQAGHIALSLDGNKSKLALLTPRGRTWYGPILEFDLHSSESGGSTLRGRFRLTYTQMLSCM